MPSGKVAISVSSKLAVPLVFNIEDVKRLRERGAVGILCGTLPTAAQQNLFLTVPLRLMAEEAVWLVASGYAYFLGDDVLLQEALEGVGSKTVEQWGREERRQKEQQLAWRRQQRKEREAAYGGGGDGGDRGDLAAEGGDGDGARRLEEEQSLFIETCNESRLTSEKVRAFSEDAVLQQGLVNAVIARYLKIGDYLMFKSLREQNYFLSPGARFGARFIAYPGDPLRYHSHMAVQPAIDYYTEAVDLQQVVCGGRLGTGVKKLWILGGVRYREVEAGADQLLECGAPVSFFSIEWAGFG
ncbi:tRNA splicing endonuclease subunit SEN34 Ecym_6164 [Eremothecium cymbalariae DBVPG|uniref:tRNA-splicing endonuclease subunit Sen34 n=1 Tax=Eremothecium cymbalariae (strain CBS 270.75 / DBVPG 7215 / KCTC 17166 / NRRL Y-17582) TaxID=931890 RepID=G8JV70_ERECY|nr:hypothetical protein Ecym_6164 [Eremothecium cymbalariae DBVPG\